MERVEGHAASDLYLDGLTKALTDRDAISVELFIRGAQSVINVYNNPNIKRYEEVYGIYKGCFDLTSKFVENSELNLSTSDGIQTYKIAANLFKLCHEGVQFGWQKGFGAEEAGGNLEKIIGWYNKFGFVEEHWKAVNNMLILSTTHAISLPPKEAKGELEDILLKYKHITNNVSTFTRGVDKLKEDFLLWSKIRNNVGQVLANLAFTNLLLRDEPGTNLSLQKAKKEVIQSSVYVSKPDNDEEKISQFRALSNLRFIEYIDVLQAIRFKKDYSEQLDCFVSGLGILGSYFQKADPGLKKLLTAEFDAEINRRILEGVLVVLLVNRSEPTRPLRELLSSLYPSSEVIKLENMNKFSQTIFEKAQESAENSTPDDKVEFERCQKMFSTLRSQNRNHLAKAPAL